MKKPLATPCAILSCAAALFSPMDDGQALAATRTATESFVTNRIANATNKVLQSAFLADSALLPIEWIRDYPGYEDDYDYGIRLITNEFGLIMRKLNISNDEDDPGIPSREEDTIYLQAGLNRVYAKDVIRDVPYIIGFSCNDGDPKFFIADANDIEDDARSYRTFYCKDSISRAIADIGVIYYFPEKSGIFALTSDIADATNELAVAIADATADYANVSNKAYSAVQEESDPTVPEWAKADTKPSYTPNEIFKDAANWIGAQGNAGRIIKLLAQTIGGVIMGGYQVTGSTLNDHNTTTYAYGGVAVKRDGINKDFLWDTTSANGIVRRSEISGFVESGDIPGIVYRLIEGTNIVDVVTNYDSQTHTPTRYLQQLDANGIWRTIWDEKRMHEETLQAALAALAEATNALAEIKADRAWSKYTSGLGADAPTNTTWISTPQTVFAGGLENEKFVTSSGDIFILCSNGMSLEAESCPTNAAFWSLTANGEELYRFEKTDSRVVYVPISDVRTMGSYLLVGFTGWQWPDRPLARVRRSLYDDWLKEEDFDDTIFDASGNVASVTWTATAPYVCTIENLTGGNQIFAGFYYEAQGESKIIPNGVTVLDGGIHFNGTNYYPSVSNGQLIFTQR